MSVQRHVNYWMRVNMEEAHPYDAATVSFLKTTNKAAKHTKNKQK